MTSLLSPLPRGNSRSLLFYPALGPLPVFVRHGISLCLVIASIDEISQSSPHDVSKIVYSLANGVAEQRASRTGAARSVVRWICAVLSSGERTITTELASASIKPRLASWCDCSTSRSDIQTDRQRSRSLSRRWRRAPCRRAGSLKRRPTSMPHMAPRGPIAAFAEHPRRKPEIQPWEHSDSLAIRRQPGRGPGGKSCNVHRRGHGRARHRQS